MMWTSRCGIVVVNSPIDQSRTREEEDGGGGEGGGEGRREYLSVNQLVL